MKGEKSSIESFFNTIGQILGVIIVWFIIGAGWNGIHDWFCRSIQKKVPSEVSGEKFGKRVFWIWIGSILLVLYTAASVNSELGAQILLQAIKLNICFAIITFIGLIYFFRNLNR